MKLDEKDYGVVRYGLQPRESKDVKKLIQQRGGLTHDEIRELADGLGVSSKPIINALNELNKPILTRTSRPIPATLLARHAGKKKAKAAEEDGAAAPSDLEGLRRENARLRKEIVEHRRIRALADQDLAKARKEMERARAALTETAELRRRHQEEQAALEDPRKQVEELTDALRICRQVLLSLCGRYAQIVTRLPYSQLEDLVKKAKAELKRRENGGRRKQWPGT